MAPKRESDPDDVLVCEFAKRPRGAPAIFDVLPSVRGLERHAGALHVTFDPDATAMVTACIAAERLCCPTLHWDLESGPGLRLTVRGSPGQLDQLALLFSQPAA